MNVNYRVNGKTVSRKTFNSNPKGAGNIRRSYESRQIIKSDGAAVHPKDRKAAEAHAKKHGVPTHFDRDGRPHFRSLRHQTDYLRKINLYNKDGIH